MLNVMLFADTGIFSTDNEASTASDFQTRLKELPTVTLQKHQETLSLLSPPLSKDFDSLVFLEQIRKKKRNRKTTPSLISSQIFRFPNGP